MASTSSSTLASIKTEYKDESTHDTLPTEHIRNAVYDELDYFCKNVWVGVSADVARADPHGKLINCKFVNCNKHDAESPGVRARLVAQEVSHHGDESFYAATPPLEAKRMLLSQLATEHGETANDCN